MTDRAYRSFLGLLLLMGLYFDSSALIYALVVMLFFEGITGWLVPRMVNALRRQIATDGAPLELPQEYSNPKARFPVESERVWRVVVGAVLLTSYYFYAQMWFFPWFMGFVVFGSGLSGVCPMLLLIRWTGFK